MNKIDLDTQRPLPAFCNASWSLSFEADLIGFPIDLGTNTALPLFFELIQLVSAHSTLEQQATNAS